MTKRLRRFLQDVADGEEYISAIEPLLDASATPMLVTDIDDKVVLANARACALLSLPAREVEGRPRSLLLQEFLEGTDLKIEEVLRPIRTQSGAIVGQLCEFGEPRPENDPSEVDKLRQRLEETELINEELRNLENTRNNVLSNVSHELRTPLVTIIGYVEMISRSELGEIPENAAASLKVVLRNALRLSSRIDDLLNLSRLQEEELHPHREHLSVSSVLESLLEEYQLLLEDKDLEVETDISDDLPNAWADRRLTSLAVENLIKNAVKFSPKGGSIRIRVESDEDVIRLLIEDDGPGIPSEHLARVFEPFLQVDSSPTRFHDGIGLGLPIVRRIAEAHGGRAAIERNDDQGTTAVLELPLGSK